MLLEISLKSSNLSSNQLSSKNNGPVLLLILLRLLDIERGGEWYLEKRGSPKILAGSRNLRSVFDKSRSLIFAWFVFTFFESWARISN